MKNTTKTNKYSISTTTNNFNCYLELKRNTLKESEKVFNLMKRNNLKNTLFTTFKIVIKNNQTNETIKEENFKWNYQDRKFYQVSK